ncbi:MAG: FHA domain-containing protein [Planctomycetota bacterium]
MPLATDGTPTQWYEKGRAGSSVAAISLRLRETTHAAQVEDDTVPGQPTLNDAREDQRLLWVDGVGGYLLTLAEEVSIGLPGSPGLPGADLPILADLSRRHARIARLCGRYVLTPDGPTTVDGREIDGPTVVENGAEIGLGGAVVLRFTRPHALSASALLTILSGHRTIPAADAVLLMAESCVLGPKSHSHIRCPQWTNEAILFRGAGGLLCRTEGDLLVDGKPTAAPAKIIGDLAQPASACWAL